MKDRIKLTGGGRIQELDLLRGIAILLMITGHSILVHPIDYTEIPWCQNLHRWIYSFHMELFFLISGAVYYCFNYKKYIGKRVDRILVPLLFVGIIAILFHAFGGDAVHKHSSFTDGVIGLILQGNPYWFLYTLFIICAVYPLIEKLCPNIYWELGLAAVIIFVRCFVEFPILLRLSHVMKYLPYFIIGRGLVNEMRKEVKIWPSILASVVCLALYALLWRLNLKVEAINYIRAFAMMIPFFFLTRMLLFVERKQSVIGTLQKVINNFLRSASKYSLQAYLFNGFVLVASRVFIVNILHITNPVIVIPFIVFANFAITLPVCELILSRLRVAGWLFGVRPFPLRKTE